MYKKTLAAVAILGAFAGSAMAAQVTLYGAADLGLNYKYTNTNEANADTVNAVSMATGQNTASKFGLKGEEALDNGMKVSFKLENGFKADTGALGGAKKGKLFDREASVSLAGDFGTLKAGRFGDLGSGIGGYIMKYTAMNGWADRTADRATYSILGQTRTRRDNSLLYVTPEFGGVNVYANYSFAQGEESKEANVRKNERYAAIGANYKAGAFATGFVVDTVLVAHEAGKKNKDDSVGVSYGLSYDFDVAKVYGLVQYAKDTQFEFKKFGDAEDAKARVANSKGFSYGLGLTAPVAGGNAYAQLSYLDQKHDGANDQKFNKHEALGLAAGYEYALSKRTTVYTFGSYGELKNKFEGATQKTKQGEFGFGLAHTF